MIHFSLSLSLWHRVQSPQAVAVKNKESHRNYILKQKNHCAVCVCKSHKWLAGSLYNTQNRMIVIT